MIKRTCKQCGKDFTITDSEIGFYNDKGLDLPKRCSECRKKNKKNNTNTKSEKVNINNNEKEYVNENIGNHNNSNAKEKGKTFRNIIIVGILLLLTLVGKLFNIDFDTANIGAVLQNQQSSSNTLEFRNDKLWEDHFLKHGDEFGYKTKEEYLNGANEVITSSSSLYKQEGEDGDNIYYDEKDNEIVFVSQDGYIRTYFRPSEGIEYFNRQ